MGPRQEATLESRESKALDLPTSQTVRTLLKLRELILNGELKPGERVSELPLVERQLRHALPRLEQIGRAHV